MHPPCKESLSREPWDFSSRAGRELILCASLSIFISLTALSVPLPSRFFWRRDKVSVLGAVNPRPALTLAGSFHPITAG